MLASLAVSAFGLLLLSFPFMIVLFATFLIVTAIYLPDVQLTTLVQQTIAGISPASLVCVPMFIFAGTIMASGASIERMVIMVRAFLGHIPGGLPITTNAACTLFGSVSGSTQASVAAIGGVMRPMLLQGGYSSSFSLGLIISSSNLAWLIPPSIGFIIYGVATRTSIGQLFLAGVGPGLLIFVMFSIYSFFYSKKMGIGLQPKASWSERGKSIKRSALVFGFPVIILGGMYTGFTSPTEAAAFSVLYAVLLEGIVYRVLSFKKLMDHSLQTGVITGVVFILMGGGQGIAWLLSYTMIPQELLPLVFGADPSALKVIIVINIIYFIAGMFVDPIISVFVLSPFFAPYVAQAGINSVFLGVLVCLQGAFAGVTPPSGVNIFTAMVVFQRPYLETIREVGPFIALMLVAIVILVLFPDIALFLPNLAFG